MIVQSLVAKESQRYCTICTVAITNHRERRMLIQHHIVETIKDVDRNLVNASDGSIVENEPFLN